MNGNDECREREREKEGGTFMHIARHGQNRPDVVNAYARHRQW